MLNDSVPSALHGIPVTPTAVRNQQGALHDVRRRSQHVGKGPAVMPSRSSRQADAHGSPTRRYSCDMCDKHYAQPQGLSRHQRETHSPRLCRHCGVFEWGRPYVLKEHLEKWHPGVNPDAELEEIKRNGRSTTTITRCLPQISPSTPELEQWGLAEFQLHPPTLPLPAMMGLPSVSLPPFPPVAYRPQPESMEYFPPATEYSRVVQDPGMHARAHIRFAHALSIQY